MADRVDMFHMTRKLAVQKVNEKNATSVDVESYSQPIVRVRGTLRAETPKNTSRMAVLLGHEADAERLRATLFPRIIKPVCNLITSIIQVLAPHLTVILSLVMNCVESRPRCASFSRRLALQVSYI